MSAKVFVVYGHAYCHLCEDMVRALQGVIGEFGGGGGWSVESVDIGPQAALEARFGERVPVLLFEGRELCHYHLDVPKVREVLGAFG